MAMIYDPPPTTGPLRQGEILGPIWDHRVAYPPREVPWGQQVQVRSELRELVVVLTPDCDLEWDYNMRFLSCFDEQGEHVGIADHSQAVGRVLMCGLQDHDEMRPRFKRDRDIWNRVRGNQDERYHRLPCSEIAGAPEPTYLHDLYLDFKKATSIECGDLYGGVLAGDVERMALLPAYYLHDVIHRFYGFLSRVALPE
jgi:hypothetical protein